MLGCAPFIVKDTFFTVNPEKQIFIVLVGEGGDVISFLMKHDHLDFRGNKMAQKAE